MCGLYSKTEQTITDTWLASITRLAPVPSVIQQAIAILDSESSNYDDIGRVVSQDEAITAKILQVINSAFYGLPTRVGTVSQAIALLGFEQVRLLLLGLALFHSGRTINPTAIANRELVWQHALSCAGWARAIAGELGYEPLEQAFIAGLLHDVGKIVLADYAPEQFKSAVDLSQQDNMSSCEAERAVMGVDHVEIGALVSKHWRFPPVLHDCIEFHHDEWPPITEGGEAYATNLRQLLAIVRVANLASHLFASEHPAADSGFDISQLLRSEAITQFAEQVKQLQSRS